jgi:hypothetical protein
MENKKNTIGTYCAATVNIIPAATTRARYPKSATVGPRFES